MMISIRIPATRLKVLLILVRTAELPSTKFSAKRLCSANLGPPTLSLYRHSTHYRHLADRSVVSTKLRGQARVTGRCTRRIVQNRICHSSYLSPRTVVRTPMDVLTPQNPSVIYSLRRSCSPFRRARRPARIQQMGATEDPSATLALVDVISRSR